MVQNCVKKLGLKIEYYRTVELLGWIVILTKIRTSLK